MAVPKEKVLPILKEKLKGKGYPKTFIEKASERYAGKIDTEEDIEEYLTEKVEDLIEADKEADRRATAATNKAKADAAKAITGKSDDDQEAEITEDDPTMPAWAKEMVKQNKALSDKLLGIETAKSAETIATRFKAHEKLKNVPEFGFKGRIPKTEEEFEDAVNELAEDFKAYKPAPVSTDRPRIGGAGVHVSNAGEASKEVPAAIKAFTAQLNKQSSTQQS